MVNVHFLGSHSGEGHQKWYRMIAPYYDFIMLPHNRAATALGLLNKLFREHGSVHDVLDVACGTFSIGIGLLRRGYKVSGRDLSPDMLRVARRNLRRAGLKANLDRGDMRSLHLARKYDAVLCLGAALCYAVSAKDVRDTMRSFRRCLRPGGLLIVDTTNFDAWIDKPANARVETDWHAPNGTRVAVFAFNEQNRRKTVHTARQITVVKKAGHIYLHVEESPMRIWGKRDLVRLFETHGFEKLAVYGDLKAGVRYQKRKSPHLVCVGRLGARP